MLGAASAAELKRAVYSDLVVSAEPAATGGERQTLRRLDGQTIDIQAIIKGGPAVQRIVLRPVPELSETGGPTEEPFLLVAESVRDRAMITLDAAGNIAQWNEAAERITGYSADEIIGRPTNALAASEKEAAVEDQVLLRTAVEVGRAEHEGWKKREDGSEYYAATSLTPLFDRKRNLTGFGVMIRDLTSGGGFDTLQNEEQVRQAQRMEAVGRLASGIAHDFNNLLTAIAGYTALVLSSLDDSDTRREDLQEVVKAAQRATALTRQLLAVSRRQILQPSVLDLNMLVADLEKMLRRTIPENIDLQLDLGPMTEAVRADRGQLEQVVLNLAINAGDAMPEGGQLRLATAAVDVDEAWARRLAPMPPARYARLTVSDRGIGMAPEIQSRIFEAFFTTKERGKGTGLGLATVYGIVKQSGGFIWVESKVGQGTTFEVYLPVVHEPVTETMPLPSLIPQHSAGTQTIMLAEDDGAVRRLARDVLTNQGYTVLDARDGEEALQLARQYSGPIHLLIADVVMPGLSGRELSARVSVDRPDIRVLYTSGYTENLMMRAGFVEGLPLLPKPFLPADLLRRVGEILGAVT
jgi:PAS domain S-box-containing protein